MAMTGSSMLMMGILLIELFLIILPVDRINDRYDHAYNSCDESDRHEQHDHQ